LVEWSGASAPVAFLLSLGIAVGPFGINLLTVEILSLLDPIVPVALAALGVHVGLALGDRRPDNARLLAAAGLDAAVTALVVSVGVASVGATMSENALALSTVALVTGVAAASSLTLPAGDLLEPRTAATRVMEIGVLIPIAAGELLLAWLREGSFSGALILSAQVLGVALAIAAAAWLLLTRASTETEERVLAVSALLLLGGVAGALGVSALFVGLVGGACWRYAGRQPRETIRRDVLFVQHPLVILVLLAAGARAVLSPAALAFGASYLVLRVFGKLAGGLAASRVPGVIAPRGLGLHLLPPGVFGVAFVLNVAMVAGNTASFVLAAVVVGTIGSEIVALMLSSRSTDP
jgi:hypothetical protein